jgi:hypothetical protein
MSSTLLRLGLWIVIIVLAAYVLRDTLATSPVAEFVDTNLMQEALVLGGALVAAGVVTRLFERASKLKKQRCIVCKAPVAHGAIYCRAHLRNVLHHEDAKLHMTQERRLPSGPRS